MWQQRRKHVEMKTCAGPGLLHFSQQTEETLWIRRECYISTDSLESCVSLLTAFKHTNKKKNPVK